MTAFHVRTGGEDVTLSNNNRTACGYGGLVFTAEPVTLQKLFELCINRMGYGCSIGVTRFNPDTYTKEIPEYAKNLREDTWMYSGCSIMNNHKTVIPQYGRDLRELKRNDKVGVMCTSTGDVHFFVDGVDQGVAVRYVHGILYGVVELWFGDVSIIQNKEHGGSLTSDERYTHSLTNPFPSTQHKQSESEYDSSEDEEAACFRQLHLRPHVHRMLEETIRPPDPCLYEVLCRRFKESMNIPASYFDTQHDLCFCDKCYSKRRESVSYNCGKPPKRYAVPKGWFRFALRSHARSDALDVFDKWHRAFHGTSPSYVEKILNDADLVTPGEKVLGAREVTERPGHYNDTYKPDKFNTKQVFVTPSIVYAGMDLYADPQMCEDVKRRQVYSAKTVLQVCINPGSYTVGRHTPGRHTHIDPLFADDELEWSTDQRGATILYGLLIKMSRVAN